MNVLNKLIDYYHDVYSGNININIYNMEQHLECNIFFLRYFAINDKYESAYYIIRKVISLRQDCFCFDIFNRITRYGKFIYIPKDYFNHMVKNYECIKCS